MGRVSPLARSCIATKRVPATGERPLHRVRNLVGPPIKQDSACEDATIAAGATERRAADLQRAEEDDGVPDGGRD